MRGSPPRPAVFLYIGQGATAGPLLPEAPWAVSYLGVLGHYWRLSPSSDTRRHSLESVSLQLPPGSLAYCLKSSTIFCLLPFSDLSMDQICKQTLARCKTGTCWLPAVTQISVPREHSSIFLDFIAGGVRLLRSLLLCQGDKDAHTGPSSQLSSVARRFLAHCRPMVNGRTDQGAVGVFVPGNFEKEKALKL